MANSQIVSKPEVIRAVGADWNSFPFAHDPGPDDPGYRAVANKRFNKRFTGARVT